MVGGLYMYVFSACSYVSIFVVIIYICNVHAKYGILCIHYNNY